MKLISLEVDFTRQPPVATVAFDQEAPVATVAFDQEAPGVLRLKVSPVVGADTIADLVVAAANNLAAEHRDRLRAIRDSIAKAMGGPAEPPSDAA